jgi:hypothetical protein
MIFEGSQTAKLCFFCAFLQNIKKKWAVRSNVQAAAEENRQKTNFPEMKIGK